MGKKREREKNKKKKKREVFFFQAEDGIRDKGMWLEFRRVLFRSPILRGGLVKGNKVEKLLKNWLNNASFSETKIPLGIVTTDLITGETVVFTEGKLATAVRASMSIPTLFTPVKLNNKLLVDGGLSNPIPDDLVKKMGADIVISVNLDNYIKNEEFLEKRNLS